ncbi:MAG: hypothetical protein QM722_18750 [Piscinibacter sp.]
MDSELRVWWTLLCGFAALNIVAWAVSARRLRGTEDGTVRLQLLLSAGYVLGCAYRSALPVFDIQRLCLVDSWASSVIVGRTVATVAELCFAAQWAVLLAGSSTLAGSRPGRFVAAALVPIIAVAECFSWHAVLTTSNFGHVVEEALWGSAAAASACTLFALSRRHAGRARLLLQAAAVAGALYTAYMFAIDVPMYWARWMADELAGRTYLTLGQGIADASSRWVVSHRWDHWRSEFVWMSLYFSCAVWVSIGLAHVRRPSRTLPAAEA